MDECIVYLERLYPLGDSNYGAYLDFRLPKDIELFIADTSDSFNVSKDKSIIHISSFKSSKHLVSDRYYKLNTALLKPDTRVCVERGNESICTVNNDSVLVASTINLSFMAIPTSDSTELLQSHKPLDPDEMKVEDPNVNIELDSLSQIENTNLELIVRDVGQANWNELRQRETIKMVYDIGAPLDSKRMDVDHIYKSREEELKRDKPVLVISHWDMDHIHCLKYLDERTIQQCFSKCVCVDKMKSITSVNVYSKIRDALGVANVCAIPPAATSTGWNMHLWKRFGMVSFYYGENRRNINFSGLSLFVKGLNASAIFTGDLALIQAKNVYLAELAASSTMTDADSSQPHILIAPHHSGDYSASARDYVTPISSVAISVSSCNLYGHPHPTMLQYLKNISNNNVSLTSESGDLMYSL